MWNTGNTIPSGIMTWQMYGYGCPVYSKTWKSALDTLSLAPGTDSFCCHKSCLIDSWYLMPSQLRSQYGETQCTKPQVSLTHCSWHASLYVGGELGTKWSGMNPKSVWLTVHNVSLHAGRELGTKWKLNEAQVSLTHCSQHVSLYIGRELGTKWSGMNHKSVWLIVHNICHFISEGLEKMKLNEPQVSLTHCSQHVSLHIGRVEKKWSWMNHK